MSATNQVAIPTITNEELNTPVTFEEAIAFSGLSEADVTVIVNPYEVVNQNKDSLLGVPFYIRLVRFPVDKETNREYSVTYLVTKDGRMVVMTDGSTGIYKQLLSIVNKREADGHPTPEQNMLIANGLRKSDYIVQEGEAKGSKATTYYLA